MRKLSFFLAFALLITGSAFAQNGIISIDNVTNEYTSTQLRAGNTHVVSINYDYRSVVSDKLWIGSNGFEVYSPDGADWGYLQGYAGTLVSDAIPGGMGGPTAFQKHYDFDGATWTVTGSAGLDPASGGVRGGFYLATMSVMGTEGATSGVTNGIALTLEFTTLYGDDGLTMCIDTCDGITAWEWAAGSDQDFPNWDNGLTGDEPRCWEVYAVPNIPPVFDGTGDAIPVNHCAPATYTLTGNDGGDGPGPLTFSLVAPYDDGTWGEIDPVTGVWNWLPADIPQSGDPTIIFQIHDGIDFAIVPFTLEVNIENNPPVFDVCPTDEATVSAGTERIQTLAFSDPDVCDVPTISLSSVTGDYGVDVISIVGNTVGFTPDPEGGFRTVVMTIEVTDGDLTDECILTWKVILGSAYQVQLDKLHNVLQGHFVDMPIILHSVNGDLGIGGLGGFDILVAYDASALAFQLAFGGDLYDDPYNWEYFTYRYGAYGNCGNACPSGMLRVIGLAETNNGVATAECIYDAEAKPVLAYLRFLVSNDRTLECQYVPVRFFWYDCTDNILSSCDGSVAYLSAKVYDYVYVDPDFPFAPFIDGEMSNGTVGFPTFQGTQDNCLFEQGEKVAKADVDFQNGGIDIVCADSIDARGDINLNGLAYEIADAVMFTNYFISGLSAFEPHIDGSIAASDCNADGIALSVADLVYLIRVVIGDAAPYPKTAPVAANITYGNERFNVDVEMGAAHIVMEGNVQPTLLAENMEMLYASNGQTTSILVYSTEANQSFRGDFLQVNGNVVSTEFATFTGARVAAKVMPSTFEVAQNYPNPFNPTTTFKFTVPNGGDWNLGVYNITGQLVESFSGVSQTGYETVVWDASDLSSGIYFYRVSTDEQSVTKKAVLLK